MRKFFTKRFELRVAFAVVEIFDYLIFIKHVTSAPVSWWTDRLWFSKQVSCEGK